MVAVLSKTGIPLMPTTRCKARRLIKKGRAVIEKYRPFTIRLLDREDGAVQKIEFCCDTGYYRSGISIKSRKQEYVSMLAKAPSGEKNIPLYWMRIFSLVMPISHVVFEMGQFDIQLLKNMEKGLICPGNARSRGRERYLTATLREAVFTRDEYTCQYCGRSIESRAILHVHHIVGRDRGGENCMENLICLCEKCHTPENHQPGGKLRQWRPKLKSFKGVTGMTALRWSLYGELTEAFPDLDIRITYGAETKCRRRELDLGNLKRNRENDAYVMGDFHPGHQLRLL